MEGNSVTMASSIPALSAVTISSSLQPLRLRKLLLHLELIISSKSMYNYMEQGTTTSLISLAIVQVFGDVLLPWKHPRWITK
eukprot:13833070-Ditylum_brightwellii.AAC.1